MFGLRAIFVEMAKAKTDFRLAGGLAFDPVIVKSLSSNIYIILTP